MTPLITPNVVTWNIELEDKEENGAYVVERITCLGLSVSPNSDLFAVVEGNTIVKAWAPRIWRRFWRSEIQPALGGNA